MLKYLRATRCRWLQAVSRQMHVSLRAKVHRDVTHDAYAKDMGNIMRECNGIARGPHKETRRMQILYRRINSIII